MISILYNLLQSDNMRSKYSIMLDALLCQLF